MGRRPHHYAKSIRASFFHGVGRLVVECEIDHGKGLMAVKAPLSPVLVGCIAKFALLAAAEPDQEHHGHCWWHVENPDREYPYETCSPEAQANGAKWAVRVRDVLPAGPEKL